MTSISNNMFSIKGTRYKRSIIIISKKIARKATQRNKIRRIIKGLINNLNYSYRLKRCYIINIKDINKIEKLLEFIKSIYINAKQ